jgi:hypothetical protein
MVFDGLVVLLRLGVGEKDELKMKLLLLVVGEDRHYYSLHF